MMLLKNPEQQVGRVDELEGLRGFLALWVVVSHLFCWTGFWEFTAPRHFHWLWTLFIDGETAVETFMILSGFAISALLQKRHQPYGQFLLGRALRLYPVYWICLALGIIVALFLTPFVLQTAQWRDTIYFEWNRTYSFSETSATGLHTFWHLTLLNGLIPKRFLPSATATLLTPAWSITLEWQYYLVAPFLARWLRSGLGLLFLVGVAWLGHHQKIQWSNPHPAFLPAQLSLFLIGIGSYHLYELFAKLSLKRSSAFAVPVAALVAASILTSWHTFALTLWALVFGCIFIQGDDLFSRAVSTLRTVLLSRWLQRLGRISYSVYLVHWPLILILLAALFYCHPGISSAQALLLLFCLGLPIILCVASLLHTYVERPFMALGKQLCIPAQIIPKASEKP